MATSGMVDYVSANPPWYWDTRCLNKVIAAANRNESIGYVDGAGRALSMFEKGNTWGINRTTCFRLCNAGAVPMDFQFQSFAAAFTSYLLPWLALIAQLPTQNGNKNDGFIGICMIMGSPALTTYSLMLTIRNRYWVREEFGILRRRFKDIRNIYFGFEEKLCAMQYVLEESQQVPLRVCQSRGWFSSLVVMPENDQWWASLRNKLQHTRRGRTLSLIFQLLAAVVAWLFTVIAAFVASLGNITTALQISAGSIWLWMIGIGTQQHSDSIDSALETDTAYLTLKRHDATNQRTYSRDRAQYGLLIADKNQSGLMPCTSLESEDLTEDMQGPNGFFNLRGDEKRRGPTFNYARVFTYCQVIRTFEHALKNTMENVCNRRTCSGEDPVNGQDFKQQLRGNAEQTEAYCGLGKPHDRIYAYPEWDEIPVFIWKGLAFSAGLAMFLQWGTTGAAMMIAYLTPTKGLGCRTGGYLIYGVVATVSWFLLATSALFSHSAMLRYQRKMQKTHTVINASAITPSDVAHDLDRTSEAAEEANGHIRLGQRKSSTALTSTQVFSTTRSPEGRNKWDWLPVRVIAAIMRYIGKTLAVGNGFFLVAISLLEFVGGYENCWCKTDSPGLGEAGWVLLFKSSKDLEQAARLPWAMGVTFSILVCLSSFGVFWGAM